MRTAALTLAVRVQGWQEMGLLRRHQRDIWLGSGGEVGSLWVQEMGCGEGRGKEKRRSSAERTERTSTESTGLFRELK